MSTAENRRATAGEWAVFLAIVLVVAVVALIGLLTGATNVITATRIAPDRVDVRIERRILGIIPWKSDTLTDATDAGSSDHHARSSPPGDRTSRNRRSSQLIIKSRTGATLAAQDVSFTIGTRTDEIVRRIRAVIATPHTTRTSAWQADWLALLVGSSFSAVLALMTVSILRSVFHLRLSTNSQRERILPHTGA